eukprot:TRINITY_DN966_c3_g1_i2.p1 TRINITY_DN966_c3_g1~~TRINITY_DN966_c3_g1_i2.p1  ORF type:complete len:798 (+),score=290.57 TRINITY_DN966_c3_g1_i2:71-2464(+)
MAYQHLRAGDRKSIAVGSGGVGLSTPLTAFSNDRRRSCYIPQNGPVPRLKYEIIDMLCINLEYIGLDFEGIFRLSGESVAVSKLFADLNNPMETFEITDLDVNIIASVLKSYLREQPTPLIPFENFNEFVDAVASVQDEPTQLSNLMNCIDKLPEENKMILKRLLQLLSKVVQLSHINKMTSDNIGVVFGPSLMRSEQIDLASLSKANFPTTIFSVLSKHATEVIKVLPSGTTSFRFFKPPSPMSDNDWRSICVTANTHFFYHNDIILQEGQFNSSLHRILRGRVQQQTTDKFFGASAVGDLFAENSFLGKFVTDTQSISLDNGVQIQKVDYRSINHLLSIQPNLFRKFYWNVAIFLANKYCAKIIEKPADLATLPASRESFLLPQHIVKVTFKDGNYKTFTVSDGTTIIGLVKNILKKCKVSNPEKHNIYECSNEHEKPNKLTDDIVVARLLYNSREINGYGLYFTDSPPSPNLVQIPIKEYPNVTINGKQGFVSIFYHGFTQLYKRLGFEKKRTYNYNEIHFDNLDKFIIMARKKEKVLKIQFTNYEDVNEAYHILKWACTKYNTRNARQSRSRIQQEEFREGNLIARGIVKVTCQSSDQEQLNVNEGEIINILREQTPDFWYGESNGDAGKISKQNVEMVREPEYYKLIVNDGYKTFKNLPTLSDWDTIFANSKQLKFTKDQIILPFEDRNQCLYLIQKGTCKIEVQVPPDGAIKVIGLLNELEIFGEQALMTGTAQTQLVAVSDEVLVNCVEALVLNQIIKKEPILAGRFFKLMCVIIDRRTQELIKKQLTEW